MAMVHDGDTIKCQDQRIRLTGLDAPELAQSCDDQPCGIMARDELISLINGRQVTCDIQGTDKYKRYLGECWIDMININAWMVQNGWAVSYYGDQYKEQQLDAMQHQRGIWKFQFEMPSEFRKRMKLKTIE